MRSVVNSRTSTNDWGRVKLVLSEHRLSSERHDEAGLTLLLALVFLVTVSMVLLALLDFTSSDLLNSSNLKSQASLEYAADGATDAAVQWVRYGGRVDNDSCGEYEQLGDYDDFCLYVFDDTTGTTPAAPGMTLSDPTLPALCLPNGAPSVTMAQGGPSIAVYCLNDGLASSSTSAQRSVIFSACPSSESPSACTSSPILQAQVEFKDYSIAGAISYGSQMTILSWVVETANN
jgi:hypothetical protein